MKCFIFIILHIFQYFHICQDTTALGMQWWRMTRRNSNTSKFSSSVSNKCTVKIPALQLSPPNCCIWKQGVLGVPCNTPEKDSPFYCMKPTFLLPVLLLICLFFGPHPNPILLPTPIAAAPLAAFDTNHLFSITTAWAAPNTAGRNPHKGPGKHQSVVEGVTQLFTFSPSLNTQYHPSLKNWFCPGLFSSQTVLSAIGPQPQAPALVP